jgi:arsenate reductase-like glutaredoxin family protein
MFDCIEHNSKSRDPKEKYAFYCKTRDLSILLERYTPRTAREELQEWYKQLKDRINEINNSGKSRTKEVKDKMILEERYRCSLEVHFHNQRILMNSPIIEVDAEGELDITDEDVIKMVRGGKRTDDKGIVFKQ